MNIVGTIAGQSINGKVGIAAIRYVKDADLYPAIAAYLEDNPVEAPVTSVNGKTGAVQLTAEDVGALAQDDLQAGVDAALALAKASGEFDGQAGEDGGYYTPSVDAGGNLLWSASNTDMPAVAGANIKGPPGTTGKSAYQYAQDGGYTGTEAEFAAKLAAEKFANPNALTFTGAVTGSYDGSEPLTVEIPSGGGGSSGSSWKLIRTVDIVSGTSSYSFDKDNDGNSFKLKNFLVLIDTYLLNGYLEIKPNDNFSFVQRPIGKKNYPFSFMMKRATDGRYILENSTTNQLTFERKISGEYSSFGEFTSFSFWFSVAPASDTTMYILGEDV